MIGTDTNVGNGKGTNKIEGRRVYLNRKQAYLIVLTIDMEAQLTLDSDGNTATLSLSQR